MLQLFGCMLVFNRIKIVLVCIMAARGNNIENFSPKIFIYHTTSSNP